MRVFFSLVSSEILKLRRTLALWMIVLGPLAVVILQSSLWLNAKNGFGTDLDLWLTFTTNILSMWSLFMYPLVCALVLALIYHYEHATAGWQKLYTLPVAKWKIIASKIVGALLLALSSFIVLMSISVIGAFVVDALHPNIEMPREIPIATIAQRAFYVFVSMLLVFAIQNFVSWRWETLAVPIGVGIAGTFAALFASGWKYGYMFPWLMGIHALFQTPDKYDVSLWGGFIGGVVILVTTVLYSSRRDIG
jgi:hypothetical protein